MANEYNQRCIILVVYTCVSVYIIHCHVHSEKMLVFPKGVCLKSSAEGEDSGLGEPEEQSLCLGR